MGAITPLYLLFVLIGASLVAMGLRRYVYAVAGLFFLVLNVPNYPPVYPTLFLALLSFAITLSYNLQCKLFVRYTTVAGIILFFILFFNFLALVREIDIAKFSITVGNYVMNYCLACTMIAAFRHEGFLPVMKAIIMVYFVSMLFGFYQFMTFQFLFERDYLLFGRFVFPAIEDANYSGLYLLFFISCYLAYSMEQTKISLFEIITFLLSIAAIVLTLSRTTMMIVLIVIGIHYSLNLIMHKRQAGMGDSMFKYFMLGYMVFGVMLVMVMNSSKFWILFNEVFAFVYDNNIARLIGRIDTLSIRQSLWKEALQSLELVDWIIGKGDVNITDWNANNARESMTLHNMSLTLIVKYGVFASFAYIVFMLHALTKYFLELNPYKRFMILLICSYGLFTLTVSDEVGIFILTIIMLFLLHPNDTKEHKEHYE